MRKTNAKQRLLGCMLGIQILYLPAMHAQSTYAYSANHTKSFIQRSKTEHFIPGELQKQTLLDVLRELNKIKGIYFLFSEQSLGDKLVNPIGETDIKSEKILDQVLKNTGLKFKKVNDKTFVILSEKRSKDEKDYKPVNFAQNLSADQDANAISVQIAAHIISGKVTAGNGYPLPGVTVSIKGTKKATSTNRDGIFSIDANKGDVLVFSSIGYQNKEVTVGDDDNLNISLVASNQQLTEVVVTALGIKKQARALGYSTTEVDGSKFTMSREANIGNALTGQVAGVNVAGTATGPYGSSRVVIRGNASLSGNNQPLYVIDGVPYDNTNQGHSGQWGGPDYGDGLSNINPDDIESIQVLKGVAASNLYGFRGGNGAILITTKSGARARGLGIEVNNNFTANRVIDQREYQYQYGQGTQGVKPVSMAAALNSANSSWGAKTDGSDAVNFLGDNYKYSPAKDNFQHFFKTGITNQTSVALLGGNDQGHFRLGLSNLYTGPVIPNSNMKQQGVNFNSIYNVTRKLQLNLTGNYVFEQVKNRVSFSDAPGNVVASTMYLANTFDIRWLKPAVTGDGKELLPGADQYFNNPYFVAYDYQNSTKRERFTGGLTLKYNLLDWLFVQGSVTRDGFTFDLTNILPTGTGYAPGGQITVSTVNQHELNWNYLIGVNKKFGTDFTLNANVGGNSMDNVLKSASVNGAGPFVVPYFYSTNNVANRPYTVDYKRYHVNSVYGSADFGFRNYLFLTLTARNDWFSTLNINSNHYLYPSASASFVFSDALKLPDWISFGKLRVSYAQGSNGTLPYQNLLTYGLLGYTINGQVIGNINQTNTPNSALKPVKIEEKEIGLNVQFFNGRLGFDAAYYNKETTDDIITVTVSPTSAYNGKIANIGKISNKGVELLLTGVPIKTRNFSWNISWNFAQNNSKVLQLGPDGLPIVMAGAIPRWGDAVNISSVVGRPYAQIMGYAYKRDANGNKIFDADGNPLRSDKVVSLGSGVYKTTGGVTNEFHYKSLTVSVLIDYKFGAKIYSGTNLLLYNYGLQKTTLQGREGGFVGKGVTEDGKENTKAVDAQTYFQNLSTGAGNIAEEFVYDASFIKLRSLSIAYSFPQSLLKGSFIKGVDIALVSRNLAVLLKHTPNIDPESNYTGTNGQGLELSGYPAVRSLGLNVNLKF